MIYEVERTRPSLNPETEFIIVRTTDINIEMYQWLEKTFGPEQAEKGARWFLINKSIFFRHEKDFLWFSLRWFSKNNTPCYRRA